MTAAERRKRPEHHIVHDYANLVSSGLLITERTSNDFLLRNAPINSHVWHAFYMNCRKLYEFFKYQDKREWKYLTARQFTKAGTVFVFQHWTDSVQGYVNTHMLHVGKRRVSNTQVSTGVNDALYLAEFQAMWKHMMQNLNDQHKETFRNEIDFRVNSEFRHCGTLGKEFIR
jgi:hypothetical protein